MTDTKTPSKVAASKATAKSHSTAEGNARRVASLQANKAPIDYSEELDESDFAVEQTRQSSWVAKLEALKADVENPEHAAKYGKFYPIGRFAGASGAQTTLNAISKKELPFPVLLDTKRFGAVGTPDRYSKLYAAIPAPAEG